VPSLVGVTKVAVSASPSASVSLASTPAAAETVSVRSCAIVAVSSMAKGTAFVTSIVTVAGVLSARPSEAS